MPALSKRVDPSAGAAVFANDAPPPIRGAVAAAIVDKPLAPLATPVSLTAARFGAVDKVAIHTLRDEVVSPALQATMAQTKPLRLQMNIDTGHSKRSPLPATGPLRELIPQARASQRRRRSKHWTTFDIEEPSEIGEITLCIRTLRLPAS